jgi:ABC-type microcin C transport system permease subunit YejB
MQELIARISDKVGIDKELAKKAVCIIVNFLNQSAPGDKMEKLLDAIPGSRDILETGRGGMSGMMGAMAAANEMTEAGLDLEQVQDVSRETLQYAKEKVGEDTVNDIIGSIPGLSQYV